MDGKKEMGALQAAGRVLASSRLGDDVATLIVHHAAAAKVQRAWRRYTLFAHVRTRNWHAIRARLGLPKWRALVRFSQVRREWRIEHSAWSRVRPADVDAIVAEARAGWWGAPLRRSGATGVAWEGGEEEVGGGVSSPPPPCLPPSPLRGDAV